MGKTGKIGKRSVKGLFNDRSSLEGAMDELKRRGFGKCSVVDEAGRYESLSVFYEMTDSIMGIREVLVNFGGEGISIYEEQESDYNPDYLEYSIRSRLDLNRLTDI